MATERDTDQAPKKKSPLLLIVLLVNVLAVAGLVAFFLLKPATGEAAQDPAAAAPVLSASGMVGAPVNPETFASTTMEPYIVNLREDGGTRYLKVSMTLRLRTPEIVEPFRKVQDAVRDRFISYLTDLTVEDLAGAQQKTTLKKALVTMANETLGRVDVVDVYFTEFVVQ